jgi:hypothetical protein
MILTIKNYKNKDIIRPSVHGKYNLNFIDWNNEWERVSEIEMKIERVIGFKNF